MSRAYRQKYIAAFKAADGDSSGELTKEELGGVLEGLGKPKAVVEKAFAKYDEDNSGSITQAEFLIFMEDEDNAWVRVQQKTFTRWANNVLSNRMLTLENISTDLRNGILLAPLIEILTSKKVGKMNKKTRMRVQKLENLSTCLRFLEEDGCKLVNVGAEDIEEGNLKITLGLIWTLILKYQIGTGLEEGSPKWILLEWVKAQCAPYGVGQDLKNFKNGWSDGVVLCALTDSLGEEQNATLDNAHLTGDPYEDSKLAMMTALEKFAIPKLMDAEDIVENPDEHSIMTYVTYFRDWGEMQKKKASAGASTVTGTGVEGGRVSEPAVVTVTLKNQSGAQIENGGDPVGVAVTSPSGADVPCELKDNGDGTYTGGYDLEGPGDYTVVVQLRNDELPGSPFTVHFEAGTAAQSYAEGEGLSKGKTNRPCGFTIFSVDADGNRVAAGSDPFKVAITGPSGSVVADVTDAGDGTYPVTYAPTEEGDYQIAVTLFGESIKDAPFTASIKRAPNAAKSFVEGPGLNKAYDNKPNYFNIHAVDDVGAPVSGDTATVTIAPEGDEGKAIEVAVVDQGDGIYRCDYEATEAGDYVVTCQLDGKDVQGTPAKLTVRVGADASKSGGAKFQVTIMARDKDGNNKSEGGDDWEVEIKDAEGKETEVATKDHGDGSYSCNYQLPAAEGEPVEYLVSMRLGGGDIQGSPFKQYM